MTSCEPLHIARERGERRRLEVEGAGVFEFERRKRLVLAIEEDADVTIVHACGSYARCTTCRVEYLEGEPSAMTQAELMVLNMRDLVGKARLSCQVYCEGGMKVRIQTTVGSTGARDVGYPPEHEITTPPVWLQKPDE